MEWTSVFAGPEPVFQQTLRLRTCIIFFFLQLNMCFLGVLSKTDTKKKESINETKSINKVIENGSSTSKEAKAAAAKESKTLLIQKMVFLINI